MNKEEVIIHINIKMSEAIRKHIRDSSFSDRFDPYSMKTYIERDYEVMEYLKEHLT